MKPKHGQPSWMWRRSVAIAVIVFACWRLVMLEGAADTRVNETIAWGWVMLLGVLVLGYTGFATAQDIAAIFATRSGNPYGLGPQPYGTFSQTTTTQATTPAGAPPVVRGALPPKDFAG